MSNQVVQGTQSQYAAQQFIVNGVVTSGAFAASCNLVIYHETLYPATAPFKGRVTVYLVSGGGTTISGAPTTSLAVYTVPPQLRPLVDTKFDLCVANDPARVGMSVVRINTSGLISVDPPIQNTTGWSNGAGGLLPGPLISYYI